MSDPRTAESEEAMLKMLKDLRDFLEKAMLTAVEAPKLRKELDEAKALYVMLEADHRDLQGRHTTLGENYTRCEEALSRAKNLLEAREQVHAEIRRKAEESKRHLDALINFL